METIKKPEVSLVQRISMPKFPSVEIDGQVVFENVNVSLEALEAEIQTRLG